jgi:hypothetical protein
MAEEVVATIDAEEVLVKTVNSNGQVYLGRDYGGKTVRVAFEVVEDADE